MTRPLKKAHLLRCTRFARSNVQHEYARVRQIFVRLASGTFVSGLQRKLIETP
jgi:hypothetical protein